MGTLKDEKISYLKSGALPPFADLKEAEFSAHRCRRCPLWERATQTVFGAGASQAHILFVGEQPGDAEDRTGLPFVGPAGRLLDRALNQAHINRDLCYVTNAVKHFKWEPLGQRRLHKKPTSREIQACRPWLQAEIELIQPEVVVGLGATAAASIFGVPVRIADVRGKRIISTRPHHNVTIREENSIAALEVMSRFAINPKWLIYLPPTMSPCGTSQEPGWLEHMLSLACRADVGAVGAILLYPDDNVQHAGVTIGIQRRPLV